MARVVLRSEQTDGVLSIVELSSPPGFGGPPLHRHDFDETFYVTQGELIFQLGEDVFTGLRAPQHRAHLRQPQRRPGALAAGLHTGRL